MPIDVLLKETTGLSDKYVEMAVTYIRFLQLQASEETSLNKPKRKAGVLADKFVSISDDFDDTPECFEGYL